MKQKNLTFEQALELSNLPKEEIKGSFDPQHDYILPNLGEFSIKRKTYWIRLTYDYTQKPVWCNVYLDGKQYKKDRRQINSCKTLYDVLSYSFYDVWSEAEYRVSDILCSDGSHFHIQDDKDIYDTKYPYVFKDLPFDAIIQTICVDYELGFLKCKNKDTLKQMINFVKDNQEKNYFNKDTLTRLEEAYNDNKRK